MKSGHNIDFKNIPNLNGLRGVACLAVLLFHAGRLTPGSGGIAELYSRAASLGWSGVDLFFVLSGFLITGILMDSKGSSSYFRDFYARRALRIFPLYYLALGIFLLLPVGSAQPPEPSDYVRSWILFHGLNIQIAVRGWQIISDHLAHFWSLGVEEQFYLAWPLLIHVTPRQRLAALCLATVACGIALRCGVVLANLPDAALVLTPCRMDALAGGGLLAIALRDSRLARWRLRRFSWTALVSCGVALLAIGLLRRSFAAGDSVIATTGMSLLVVISAAALVLAVTAGPDSNLPRLLDWTGLSGLGKYSYAVYVFHYPITVALASYFGLPKAANLAEQLAFAAACLSLSVIAALLSWNGVEKHFLKLKSKFDTAPTQGQTHSRDL
jgi:peptidoglycan/LPS O-acetylase OafA/YrhL